MKRPTRGAWMKEIARLNQWIADLQSGMYINCVYCGHRYGPDPGTPVAMADVLKAHVEVCPKHPMSALKTENARLKRLLAISAGEVEGATGKEAEPPSPEGFGK